MSLAAIIAAALLSVPAPDLIPVQHSGLFRLSVAPDRQLDQLGEQLRLWRAQAAAEMDAMNAPSAGGPVIRRYLCDEHGVIEHGVIHRWPEFHPAPGETYEAFVIDIESDVGLTPRASED